MMIVILLNIMMVLVMAMVMVRVRVMVMVIVLLSAHLEGFSRLPNTNFHSVQPLGVPSHGIDLCVCVSVSMYVSPHPSFKSSPTIQKCSRT